MIKSQSKIKNKGFTLTEMVVVIVLLGLISILATSITLIVNHSQKLTMLDSKDEGELLRLRTAFDDWLMLHDSVVYTLNISGHRIEANSDRDLTNKESDLFMNYEDGQFVYSENVGNEPNAVPVSINFTSIKDVEFTAIEGNLICCTVSFDSTDYKILYHLHAAKIKTTTEITSSYLIPIFN